MSRRQLTHSHIYMHTLLISPTCSLFVSLFSQETIIVAASGLLAVHVCYTVLPMLLRKSSKDSLYSYSANKKRLRDLQLKGFPKREPPAALITHFSQFYNYDAYLPRVSSVVTRQGLQRCKSSAGILNPHYLNRLVVV